MIRTAPRMSIWAGLAACAGLALSGCGSNGNAGISQSGTQQVQAAAVQGIVYGPNGQFAAAGHWWWTWTKELEIVPRAYASLDDDLQPIQTTLDVSLSQLDAGNAAHGTAAQDWYVPSFFKASAQTGVNGYFEILDPSLSILDDQSHLMVYVGTPGVTLTRAFVTQTAMVRIDAVSEATVRIVLKRLTEGPPPAQLDDFSLADLDAIRAAVDGAAVMATGSTVLEVNQAAFDMAVGDAKVQLALSNAVGS